MGLLMKITFCVAKARVKSYNSQEHPPAGTPSPGVVTSFAKWPSRSNAACFHDLIATRVACPFPQLHGLRSIFHKKLENTSLQIGVIAQAHG
jgi:hypothetical protein